MGSFWSLWIIILTVVTIVGTVWLLFSNRKSKNTGPDATTGHVYDGIEEYDNPLPAWWFYMFVFSIIFAIGYLIFYPGMGNYKGVLNWTQVGQWQGEVDKAEKKYGALFAQFREMPVEQVAQDKKALKMGQRMFANNCSQCHGGDARGSYGLPNLTDEEGLYGGSAEAIKTSIVSGRAGLMPSWEAALGEQGIDSVSDYVLSLSGRDVDMASAAEGQSKYQMFCVACHGVEGKGNVMFGAPDLTNDIWLYGGSKGLVQRTLRGGRNGQMPAHKDVLSDDKIHLLTAYVYSLSQK